MHVFSTPEIGRKRLSLQAKDFSASLDSTRIYIKDLAAVTGPPPLGKGRSAFRAAKSGWGSLRSVGAGRSDPHPARASACGLACSTSPFQGEVISACSSPALACARAFAPRFGPPDQIAPAAVEQGSPKEKPAVLADGGIFRSSAGSTYQAGAAALHWLAWPPSVASEPSFGAPVPDEPTNSLQPFGKVTSRPLALQVFFLVFGWMSHSASFDW
jgi:hypothetical protein